MNTKLASIIPLFITPIRPKTGRMGRINDIDSNDTSRYYPPTTIAMTCDITSFYQTFYQFLNPVISITVAASIPFASIFLAISRLRLFMPFSMPSARPFSMPSART